MGTRLLTDIDKHVLRDEHSNNTHDQCEDLPNIPRATANSLSIPSAGKLGQQVHGNTAVD